MLINPIRIVLFGLVDFENDYPEILIRLVPKAVLIPRAAYEGISRPCQKLLFIYAYESVALGNVEDFRLFPMS